jgi:tRNA dimethylallyltransferase
MDHSLNLPRSCSIDRAPIDRPVLAARAVDRDGEGAGPSDRPRVGLRESLKVGLIVGPTGAGKTAFAIELAERLGAEIVNADSRQLYRRMDLGTAKPSAAERARVTHHLIDVCDPDRPIDVAEFAVLAHEAIAEIAARGRPVLIVGGSGLYLRVLRDGIFAGPRASADYRAELGALAAAHGAAYLHERLRQADAEAAGRISANDLPRMIRALEVFALSGIPISEHQRRHRIGTGMAGGMADRAIEVMPGWSSGTVGRGYDNLAIGLAVPRARLYAQIERRFDAMIAAGLIDEVRGLLAADVGLDRAGSLMRRTIGYREIARYLEGKLELPAAIELAKRESRRLAKRQMTWFRRERDLVWLDPVSDLDEALGRFRGFFQSR